MPQTATQRALKQTRRWRHTVRHWATRGEAWSAMRPGTPERGTD